jgi:hypothetical protein
MIRILLVVVAMACGLNATEAASGPFSHKQHAPLRMKCTSCHTGAETEESAGFPEVARCKTCHVAIASDRKIPAARVYKVRDFVVFSHARHAGAQVPCATCHGEVERQAELAVHRPTSMASCVSCHKEHKASVACNACHELGQ